jgi:hypothetical protein
MIDEMTKMLKKKHVQKLLKVKETGIADSSIISIFE